jgi:hypothetical protein
MTSPQPAAPPVPGDKPQPRFPTLIDWVETHFNPMYRRPLGGEYRWCAAWWRHAEAISRLTSLWYAWESLRLQGSTGMGIWYRDHFDHQLPYLMGARGPFYQCTEAQHLEGHQAVITPAPRNWWIHHPPGTAAEPSETSETSNGEVAG